MNDSKSSLRLLFESRACDGTDQSLYDGDFVCFHRSARATSVSFLSYALAAVSHSPPRRRNVAPPLLNQHGEDGHRIVRPLLFLLWLLPKCRPRRSSREAATAGGAGPAQRTLRIRPSSFPPWVVRVKMPWVAPERAQRKLPPRRRLVRGRGVLQGRLPVPSIR
jgi:hypothetical protein